MPSLLSIKSDISTLSGIQITELFEYIGQLITINSMEKVNHVNSMHSNLKEWIRRFKGVATKYLTNYLYWFKWLEKTKQDKDLFRMRTFVLDSVSEQVDVRQRQFRDRQPIFI